MSDSVVTVKLSRDGAEKCLVEGNYFMGVIAKVTEKEGGKEIECHFAELGTASQRTRIKVVECLSESLEERKKDILLSSIGNIPDCLKGLFEAIANIEKEVKHGDSK